jgi:uncharacterized repeat protein (TIGR03837 family)
VFCRVVDNFGDAGICWRIARQLAVEHGVEVRLWIDLPQTLAKLAPGLVPGGSRDGVTLREWNGSAAPVWRPEDVADVVVTAFAAEPTETLRAAMQLRRPVWINLEYLSAQAWVDDAHGLPSPKRDGLVEHFFFPGFSDRSGGLVREASLLDERDRFVRDPAAVQRWLQGIGVQRQPRERLLSLFCYPHADAPPLLQALAASGGHWRVLVPEGVLPGAAAPAGSGVSLQRIAFLPQPEYDRLLWACDANFVRGEDSIVRALWAARPLVWQIYPQQDDTHQVKLRAFLQRLLVDSAAADSESRAIVAAHEAWNGMTTTVSASAYQAWLAQLPDIEAVQRSWVQARSARGRDLVSNLVRFASSRL